MKTIKIAIVTPDYPPKSIGGCAVSSHLLATELRKKEYTVDVFVFNYKHKTIIHAENGTDFYYKGYPKIDILNGWVIRKKLKDRLQKYDVVFVYNVRPLLGVVPIKKHFKAPIVAVLNNLGGVTPNPTYQFRTNKYRNLSIFKSLVLSLKYHDVKYWPVGALINWISFLLVRNCAKKADHYVALTKAIGSLYSQSGYEKESMTVISNMIESRFISRSPKKSKKVKLAFIGQLSPKKGPLELLRAFLSLPQEVKDRAELFIVGKGKEEKEIKRLIATSDDAITLQSLDHEALPEFLEAIDAVVHPAKWFEPFSRIWLEAMASGCAILSSANPSAAEVLKNIALFFDVFSENDLRSSLEQVISDDRFRGKLQKKAHMAAKRFSSGRIISEFEKLILKLTP